jgi:hypothetical protein
VSYREEIVDRLRKEFPQAEIEIHERRETITEIRATLGKKIFIEIYANELTRKRSYSLICDDDRVFGYDNYQYWHFHPMDNPNTHIACEEPTVLFVMKEIKKAFQIWKESTGE